MDPYLSDEERVQQIKDWWKKNGNMLLLGIGIGLLILFSWKFWQENKINDLSNAAVKFENLKMQMALSAPQFKTKDEKERQAKTAAAIESAKELFNQFPSTEYANDAMLLLAKLYVEKGDLVGARTFLETALLRLDTDSVKYHVASLRLARLLRDSGLPDKALAKLTVTTKVPNSLRKYYEYLKGTVYENKKQCQQAVNAYKSAIDIVTEENKINNQHGQSTFAGFQQMIEHRLENVRNC